MIEVFLEGPWMGVKMALHQLPRMVQSSATWGQRKVAEGLVKRVKNHINRQDLNWPQRSERTHSNDPRILVDQEAYYSNIKSWKQGNTYMAGVKSTAYNSEGRNIANYAIINELGDDIRPPRPLWGPSIEEMGGPNGIRSVVTESIFKKVRILRSQGFEVKLGRL